MNDNSMRNLMCNTMRKNLLNWCNLVSISKKLMFSVFGAARIFLYLADHDEKFQTKI